METSGKKILILAGPNGAGKTTFAREFLPNEANCPIFVNADLIAAGLSPFDPEAAAFRAGRLMLEEIAHHAAAGRSFAFETTLSGLTYARMIRRWREDGYTVDLTYLSLDSPEEAISRVAKRVQQGGHNVLSEIVRRRFSVGRRNFETIYRPLVDSWRLFDNSGDRPRLLEEGKNS
ncbi:MAG TPA: zeta toxin family protein [Thermoanaerobaculia bacterium]|nr:zeta toxin family protein [Thermoanaerobaculia bacterium]